MLHINIRYNLYVRNNISTVLQSMVLQIVGHSSNGTTKKLRFGTFFFVRAGIYLMNIVLCWNGSGDSFP